MWIAVCANFSFKCCLGVCNESVAGFICYLWCLSFMRFPLLRFEIVNNLPKQFGVCAADFSAMAWLYLVWHYFMQHFMFVLEYRFT
uniref:Uncharacterized protein n=1 Tax=Triticum urartu TaxID=4572 RepID=A0A8R7TRP0_TRIUA